MGNLKNMNNFDVFIPRKRSQNLLIVEGNHEKNELFALLFKCFPEMNIDIDDVWIYATNIYQLYDEIVSEYGEDWYDTDVDLPFVVSKKKYPDELRYKEDFVNIVLVFDYERHDTYFSEEKILNMQKYFVDSTDVGKLYINYPMIEAYQDIAEMPDATYIDKTVSVTVRPGARYKALVRDKAVAKYVEFPNKLLEIMEERFEVKDKEGCNKCVDLLLSLSDDNNLEDCIFEILNGVVENKHIKTAQYQFLDKIKQCGYATQGLDYHKYMRKLFQQIIYHNNQKAYRIQVDDTEIADVGYKAYFDSLNLVKILKRQNIVSRDSEDGFIWVLSTCIFLIPDYNFSLLDLE